MADLSGTKIAVLVTDGVEEVELTKPVDYLSSKGAEVTIVTPNREELKSGIKSKNMGEMGATLKADKVLADVSPTDFDALYIPGGYSPDHLRLYPQAIEFVKAFADKPIFALCHGPQVLISADLVDGCTLTSWPSVRVDLENAGATWVDQEVVVDGDLITSRKPDDIPAFNKKIEEFLAEVLQPAGMAA